MMECEYGHSSVCWYSLSKPGIHVSEHYRIEGSVMLWMFGVSVLWKTSHNKSFIFILLYVICQKEENTSRKGFFLMSFTWFAVNSDISWQQSCACKLDMEPGGQGRCAAFCTNQRCLWMTNEFWMVCVSDGLD